MAKTGRAIVTPPNMARNHPSPFIAPSLLWRLLLCAILMAVPRNGKMKETSTETQNSHLFPTSETTVIPSLLFLVTACSYWWKYLQDLQQADTKKAMAITNEIAATTQQPTRCTCGATCNNPTASTKKKSALP